MCFHFYFVCNSNNVKRIKQTAAGGKSDAPISALRRGGFLTEYCTCNDSCWESSTNESIATVGSDAAPFVFLRMERIRGFVPVVAG